MADLVLSGVPKIQLGYSCIGRLPHNVKEIGNRFILILDESLNRTSIAEVVTGTLEDRGVDFFVSEISSSGEKSGAINKMLEISRKGCVQGVIAVGGEKTMHAAMCVASLFHEKESIYDIIDGKSISGNSLPLICVPTTIRSSYIFGEMFPVIDERCGKLKFIKAKDRPCKVILWDAAFNATMDEKSKAAFLLEVLSMSIESYISQKANFFSDMLSEKAFTLLADIFAEETNLSSSSEEIMTTKAGMLTSMAMAASAEGEVSLLSLLMNTQLGIKKAEVACILLPYMLKEATAFRNDRLIKAAELLKLKGDILSAVQGIIESASLLAKLREVGCSIDDLSVISEDAAESPLINTLPKSTSVDDLYNLMKQAY